MSALAAVQVAAVRVLNGSQRRARALAGAEPWLVPPLLVAGFAVPSLLGPALGVAALFWFARRVAFGRLTVRSPGDRLIAALVLIIPVSLWVTPLPAITGQRAQWLLAGVAIYYVIINWAVTAARERALGLALVIGGALAALVAPVAVAWVADIKLTIIPAEFYDRLPLLVARPIHPNTLAGALILSLPLPLALLMFDCADLRGRERLLAVCAALAIAAIVVLTKSRGAMVAGAAAGVVLALLRWRRSWLLLLLAGLAAALAVWRAGPDEVGAKLLSAGATVGVPGRLEIWSRAVYMIQDFPFTGIGMGAYEAVANELYPFFLLGPNADAPHAHNLFLQVTVDLGIFGLAAWLGLFALATAAAWRVYREGRRAGDGWSAGLGAALLAAQVALATHGVFDAAVWGAESGVVVWVLWGMCAAAFGRRERGASAANR